MHVAAFLLQCGVFALVVASEENDFVLIQRSLPKTSQNFFNKTELHIIAQSLIPKEDPNAKPIHQPSGAGKVSNLTIFSYIIGGIKAVEGQFPWQAYIIIDNSFLCGGSLIMPSWIMTAAHCLHGTAYEVTLGSIDRSKNPTGSVTLQTTQKIVHENYHDYNLNNDIGLLKLPSSIELSDVINVVKLPSLSDGSKTFEGATITVSGFGKFTETSAPSKSLNYVELPIISSETCVGYYGSDIVTSATICTLITPKSTCSGDSGGPMVYKDGSNTFKQIGIVSFGSSDGCLQGPSGFTRVTSYLGWLSEKIGQDVSGSNETESATTAVPLAGTASTTTITTTKTPATKPSNCAKANFSKLRLTCCMTQPVKEAVVMTKGEKFCKFTSGNIEAMKLKSFLTKNQVLDSWITLTESAVDYCLEKFYSGASIIFKSGNFNCDGRMLIVVQCVQQKLAQDCPQRYPGGKCPANYMLFDSCGHIF
ncbi:proclotting enzyme-like isoform X2 [Neocloeon triangulifer]|uniref:proclotting enzyme-like isoform X2 n=1 Tax=Neocloeon triangulifer TaxID=2078957 RepID=UPI00286F1C04|nr:proclotting enzyme-like isoform X2 [Neocloeon triangulifer]